MGNKLSYQALILLPSDTDASLQKAETELHAFFDKLKGDKLRGVHIQSETQNSWVVLTINGWKLFIRLSTATGNQEESQEIADRLGTQCPVDLRLKPYGARFEITSDPDPNMDYFNDYVFVVEALSSFEGAVALDGFGKLI
jgi:hypothetical protein